jgi:thiol-disulfide isomerase/thioredoxin
MRVRAAGIAMVAAAVMLVGGCGSDPGGGGSGKDGSGAGGTGAAAASASKLDFTATTLEGRSFKGASLKGRPTVLWFWAPWCGICQDQAPGTAAVAKDYAGKVNVLGVAGLDKERPMRDFVSSYDLSGVTHLSDERGDVWKRFEVTRQSVFVLLDGEGEEVDRGTFNGEPDLRRRIDGMLR